MTELPAPSAQKEALSQVEFIGLVALLSAIIAYSIDAVLPVLTQIGQELAPNAPERAPLLIPAFVLGLGLGTIVAGPLSDAFGRRRIILGGLILYAVAAALGAVTGNFTALLVSRVAMGLGAAGPRVATMAMVRDLYKGRDMARMMSFAMMTLMIVPAIAPAIGAVIAAGFGWRGVFWSFLVFAALSGSWMLTRQPETLPMAARRSLVPGKLWSGLVEVLSNPVARLATLAQMAAFGAFFGTLSTIEPLFTQTFDRAGTFPLWFALIAAIAACASLANALLVRRLGMLRVVLVSFSFHALLSVALILLVMTGLNPTSGPGFAATFVWLCGTFCMSGLSMGNLNAAAMERLGHLAGMAASVTMAVSTIGGALIAAPLSLAFDGTPLPLAFGALVLMIVGIVCVRRLQGADTGAAHP